MKFTIHPYLGLNIKTRREALGISQSELAHSCGLATTIISHYETGNRAPSLEAIIRLASRLRCTVSDLIGQTKAPIPIVCPMCNGSGMCMPDDDALAKGDK